MTSSSTRVSAVNAVLLLVLVADNGISVAGISVVSHIGCVAGAGGTTDYTLNSPSRKVAMHVVSRSIVIRSSCRRESKILFTLKL